MPSNKYKSRFGVPKFAEAWVMVYDPLWADDDAHIGRGARIESMQLISDLKHAAWLDGTIFRASCNAAHYIVRGSHLCHISTAQARAAAGG